MEIENYIEVIMIIVLLIGTIPVIIFFFRLKNNNDDSYYYKLIDNLNKQKEENLEKIKIGTNIIDDLEKKISYYKKELKR